MTNSTGKGYIDLTAEIVSPMSATTPRRRLNSRP